MGQIAAAGVMTGGNGYIKVERALWNSDEFRALSVNARVLLLDIQCGHNGRNNGAIGYGISHAVKCLRCGRSTAIRTLAELQDAGFLELVSKGSFTHKAGARAGEVSTWRLTYLLPN